MRLNVCLASSSLALVVAMVFSDLVVGNDAAGQAPRPYEAPGYQLLHTKPYLTADFDQQSFDELWKCWEEPLRSQAAAATLEERRQMAFSRYGLTVAPGDKSGRPQQYVVDAAGNWTMSCLACHQGKVAGQVIPGVPNSLYALQTLTDEMRITKLRLGKRLTQMEIGSAIVPLGTTNGTTNAVIFGVLLMASRDPDLNVLGPRAPDRFINHDHDAPPWWHFKKKARIYSDGFVAKDVRPLMQFMLIPENGPEKFREWEADYREVYSWLESLEAPRYPFAIDQSLAAKGERVFANSCAECHGTYGPGGEYPNRIVPIGEVGTDPLRLAALTPAHRQRYGRSWFGHFGQDETLIDPGGYIAPPLDGVWASAPYFHNGSVPTLWHVLHPAERPRVWQRTEDGYDQEKVGLEIAVSTGVPAGATTAQRRKYFDTAAPGKSASGHTFPDQLDESEKRALLEYLKTL